MTNNVPQETINSVLVDILKGAKDASSEIYGASKTGIVKAVDFAQEQAPLVVQEFLQWKFAQATIWTVVSVIGLVVLGYFTKKCFDWIEDSGGASVMGVIFGGFFFALLVFAALIPNVEQMVKVKIAPRVYLIEWVSDQVNPPEHHNR